MKASRAGLAVALVLTGCATGAARTKPNSLSPPAHQSRAGASTRGVGPVPVSSDRGARASVEKPSPTVTRALDTASALIGNKTIVVDGIDYGSDCTALVRAAFARAGHPFPPEARDARSMLVFADRSGAVQKARRASAGDVVFLADTPGGQAVHVGIVTRSEPDGTMTVLHRVARGVRRVRINLAYPERTSDPQTGKHINDLLRVQSRPEPAGRLVVAVSDLLRRA